MSGRLWRKQVRVLAWVVVLCLCRLPHAEARRCRIGIGGEFPSGYNGILARQGIPHEILLDYQLADAGILHRYDLIILTQLPPGVEGALEAVLDYVRDGGAAILDAAPQPPPDILPGPRGALPQTPGLIVPAESPLAPLLGGLRQFPPTRGTYFVDAARGSAARVLARFRGTVAPGGGVTPVPGEMGTPAIWDVVLGKGRLVYTGPALSIVTSFDGPQLDALAEALIRHATQGAAVPQLIPEGSRLQLRQSLLTTKQASREEPEAAPIVPEVRRVRPPGPPGPLPRGARPVEADHDSPEMNVAGTYTPGRGPAELLLSYWSARHFVSIGFAGRAAQLAYTEGGKMKGRARLALPASAEVPFLAKVRAGALTLVAGGGAVSLRLPALWEGKTAARGPALSGLSLQPVEPVYFSDDFMRTSAEPGTWDVLCGEWSAAPARNPDMGANPFTYSASARGLGWSTAGFPFWDDYVFQAAVKPMSAEGAVGLGFYFRDAKNHLRFRARVQATVNKVGDGLQVIREQGGRAQVLAQYAGCLVRGQWYRLSARVHGTIVTVAIDGRQIASVRDVTLAGGKVALFVEDAAARFDDVQVQPAGTTPLVEGGLDRGTPKFAGVIDVDTWAAPATQWDAHWETPGLFWRRGQFHGDVALSLRLPPPGAGTRRMTLLLAGDGVRPGSGYAFTVRPDLASAGPGRSGRRRSAGDGSAGAPGVGGYAPGRMSCRVALLRGGKVVVSAAAPAGREPVMRLQRVGGQLLGWLDGRMVVDYTDGSPLKAAAQIGFRAEGFQPRLSSLGVEAPQVLDYTFDQAPTDWWIGSGTWEVCNRWSCTPDWSWFGGISKEAAAVWHKREFAGDLTLDYTVGPRMVERGQGRPAEVCSGFNAVLCGDGKDVRQGYSFIVGAGDEAATASLLRNGEVVATNDAYRIHTMAHNRWFNVRAEKQGPAITLSVEGQQVLHWVDPHPLARGFAGIWTDDNGIMIPRVTLYPQGTTGALLSAF